MSTSAAAGAPPAGESRIWFAQALRALACLLVVFAHYGHLFVLAPDTVGRLCLCPPLTDLPRPAFLRVFALCDAWYFSPANFGVALFFLVSGFVIPFSLRRNTLGGFFVRRLFRLYPTLWLVQLLILAVLAYNARRYGLPFVFGKRVIASNALLVSQYLGLPIIEAVTWTLLVEELFYALCALCAWRGVLERPAVILLVAGTAAGASVGFSFTRLVIGMPRWHYPLYFLGLNCSYIVFIFIGVVLHHLYRGAWRLRLALPTILSLLSLYLLCCRYGVLRHVGGVGWAWTGLEALVLFGALLAGRRWLPYVRWVDRLAEVSYPLYLTHGTLGYVVIRAVYLAGGGLYLGFAAAFAAVLTLSALLHRFVERPGNDLGRRLTARLKPAGTANAERLRQAA